MTEFENILSKIKDLGINPISCILDNKNIDDNIKLELKQEFEKVIIKKFNNYNYSIKQNIVDSLNYVKCDTINQSKTNYLVLYTGYTDRVVNMLNLKPLEYGKKIEEGSNKINKNKKNITKNKNERRLLKNMVYIKAGVWSKGTYTKYIYSSQNSNTSEIDKIENFLKMVGFSRTGFIVINNNNSKKYSIDDWYQTLEDLDYCKMFGVYQDATYEQYINLSDDTNILIYCFDTESG